MLKSIADTADNICFKLNNYYLKETEIGDILSTKDLLTKVIIEKIKILCIKKLSAK